MTEIDLISGLADIEEQLKKGNANQEQLREQLAAILRAIQSQPAPKVENVVNVEVPQTAGEWHFTHQYDGMGRCIASRATRIAPGSKA